MKFNPDDGLNVLTVVFTAGAIGAGGYIGVNEINHRGENHDGALKSKVEQRVVDRHMTDGMGFIALRGCDGVRVKLNDPALNFVLGIKQDRCPVEVYKVTPEVYEDHLGEAEIKPDELR